MVLVPLVAEAVVAQKQGNPKEDPAKIVGRVIGLAATLGLFTWLLLNFGSSQALQLAGVSPDSALGGVASGYLRIRAVALPASLVNTVAIVAFRGHLDTSTPLYVILLQTLADVCLGLQQVTPSTMPKSPHRNQLKYVQIIPRKQTSSKIIKLS